MFFSNVGFSEEEFVAYKGVLYYRRLGLETVFSADMPLHIAGYRACKILVVVKHHFKSHSLLLL